MLGNFIRQYLSQSKPSFLKKIIHFKAHMSTMVRITSTNTNFGKSAVPDSVSHPFIFHSSRWPSLHFWHQDKFEKLRLCI